jgi:hypothetical protein
MTHVFENIDNSLYKCNKCNMISLRFDPSLFIISYLNGVKFNGTDISVDKFTCNEWIMSRIL